MAESKRRADIVLVHGLWQRGWSMAVMARRLRARGHGVRVFSYPTRGDSLDGHADRLYRFITLAPVARLELVGHSMGGLVILNMLDRHADVPPGRVVLMGTPVTGSSAARRLEKLPGRAFLFGKAGGDLLQGFPNPPARHETGMIRGTRPLGIGRVSGHFDEPSDGTVTVSETQLQGLADSIELHLTHTQMLVSTEVVDQVEQFIINGRFRHRCA